MNELVITNYKNSLISAVYEDKNMIQVTACRKRQTACVGNIYVGRVDNIVKNINAAFVKISEQISCYLDLSTNVEPLFVKKQSEKKLSVGDELIVQITKEDVKTKAPVVSASFSLTGKYLVLIHGGNGVQISKKIPQKNKRTELKNNLTPFLQENYGFVVRTSAGTASLEELREEAVRLQKEYEHIAQNGIHKSKFSLLREELPVYMMQLRDNRTTAFTRIVTNISSVYTELEPFIKEEGIKTPEGAAVCLEFIENSNDLAIRYKINHFMDKALHRTLYLNSGATLVIDPTEALTVIDVNTGKAIAGKKASEETFFAINREAATEIARQIRLRNLSGIILIDFINLADSEKEEELKAYLRTLFQSDPVQTEVVDITKLGLMEITRKKVYKTLAEQLSEAQ